MRKTLIAGNWKMHGSVESTKAFFQKLSMIDLDESVECALFPPFTALSCALSASQIPLGVQNCHQEDRGAFTGEISAQMAKEAGAIYVLCGHSERRALFGESDQLVGLKVKAALDAGLIPILCVGESEMAREIGEAQSVVTEQLIAGLKHVLKKDLHKIIFAYEPVWAIGTGKTATPEIASNMHRHLRAQIDADVTILYGGSVKPSNIAELMAEKEIDGALVGGASLDAESFAALINYKQGLSS